MNMDLPMHWEERLFVPEGRVVEEAIADTRLFVPEGSARVAETIGESKVYRRGALYLLCENGFLLRYYVGIIIPCKSILSWLINSKRLKHNRVF